MVIFSVSQTIEEQMKKFTSRPPNDIYLFSNIFSDDMCNKLIDYTNKNVITKTKIGQGENVRCREEYLTRDHSFHNHVTSKLVDIGRFVRKKYIIPFGEYDGCEMDGVVLRKIHGPTRLHMDGPLYTMVRDGPYVQVKTLRSLSVIVALNGDYDGGEIVFPSQNFKTKLKQGEAIAFPPYWTHPHYTEDLKNNTFRYTINTWLRL
jgi:hypothetical protein